MKKLSLPLLLLGIAISGGVFAQATAIKPGSIAVVDVPSNAPPFLPFATITEGFDGATATTAGCALTPALVTAGWFAKNNSVPVGVSCWNLLANVATAPLPQAGTGYIISNFNAGTGDAQLSAWLVTPRVTFGTGATLEFWARAAAGTFPDQMEIRVSTAADAGTPNVGTAATDLGTFTSLLLTINPTNALVSTDQACPTANFTATGAVHSGFATTQWCKFTISGAALPASGTGRIAFRNSVPNGGDGANSNRILLDSFSFIEGTTGGAFSAVTPSGSNITLARTLPATTSTSSLVFNVTGANGALTCTTASAGYSVAPAPLNLVVGTPGNVTVTHTGATAGTFTGIVTCTGAVGSTGGPFVYNFTTNVSPQPVPITPTTVSGTSLVLPEFFTTLPGSSTTLNFGITAGTAQLACVVAPGSAAGFTAAPNPLNLTVAGPNVVTVSYTGTVAGTFTGSLVCTPVAPATGGPFTYPLSATVRTPSPITANTAPAPISLPAYFTTGLGSSSTTLNFGITGGTGQLACVVSGAGFTATPNPLNLTVAGPNVVTVSYTGTVAGTFTGSLVCTPVAPAATGGPFTYPLSATVRLPSPITANTASGTISLPEYVTTGPGSSSTTLSFGITGGANQLGTGQLACVVAPGSAAGFTATPNPLDLTIAGPNVVTVRYTGTTAGTFTGTLVCTPVAPAATGGPFTYNLRAGVSLPTVPVPTLGNISLMLLIAGFLGLGMVLVGRRQA